MPRCCGGPLRGGDLYMQRSDGGARCRRADWWSRFAANTTRRLLPHAKPHWWSGTTCAVVVSRTGACRLEPLQMRLALVMIDTANTTRRRMSKPRSRPAAAAPSGCALAQARAYTHRPLRQRRLHRPASAFGIPGTAKPRLGSARAGQLGSPLQCHAWLPLTGAALPCFGPLRGPSLVRDCRRCSR